MISGQQPCFTDNPSVPENENYSEEKLRELKEMFPVPADSKAKILDMN